MNIFNWAQDHNINFIENIDFWMLTNLPFKWYRYWRGSNGLDEQRAEQICRNMFNHVGITASAEICRLIGFGSDGEDYYYIVKESSGGIVWQSMVCDFCSLKGKISNWAYYNLDHPMEINFCPKEKEFIVKKET